MVPDFIARQRHAPPSALAPRSWLAPSGCSGRRRMKPPTKGPSAHCATFGACVVLCCTPGQSCCMLSRVAGCRVQKSLVRSGGAAQCRTRLPIIVRRLQTVVRAAASSMQQQPQEAVPQAEAAWEWFNSMGAPKYWVRRASSTALRPAGHRRGWAAVAPPLAAGRRLQAAACLAPAHLHATPASPHC